MLLVIVCQYDKSNVKLWKLPLIQTSNSEQKISSVAALNEICHNSFLIIESQHCKYVFVRSGFAVSAINIYVCVCVLPRIQLLYNFISRFEYRIKRKREKTTVYLKTALNKMETKNEKKKSIKIKTQNSFKMINKYEMEHEENPTITHICHINNVRNIGIHTSHRSRSFHTTLTHTHSHMFTLSHGDESILFPVIQFGLLSNNCNKHTHTYIYFDINAVVVIIIVVVVVCCSRLRCCHFPKCTFFRNQKDNHRVPCFRSIFSQFATEIHMSKW